MKKKFALEKKMFVKVRYYETLHCIQDEYGETIFTGSEETAKRLLAILKRDAMSRKAKK